MVKVQKPKNDVKKLVFRVTERMNLGKGEAETGKEPSGTSLNQDVKSCATWVETKAVVGHFFSVMSDGARSPSVFC